MTEALAMTGIVKRFGALTANDHVDFSAHKGEVHALVGENGAGKTTLMNILYGVLTPNSGTIDIDGKRVEITSPSVAIKLGIGMVHQHFKLVPSLSVAENIVLGHEPGKHFLLDLALARKQVEGIATKKFGISIDPDAIVADLPVGLQQQVEIIKMLYREAQILILDEPTAVLTPSGNRRALQDDTEAGERGQDNHLHNAQAERSDECLGSCHGDAAGTIGHDNRDRPDIGRPVG